MDLSNLHVNLNNPSALTWLHTLERPEKSTRASDSEIRPWIYVMFNILGIGAFREASHVFITAAVCPRGVLCFSRNYCSNSICRLSQSQAMLLV